MHLPHRLIATITSITLFVAFPTFSGANSYPSLHKSFDARLQARLVRSLKRLGLVEAVKRKELCLALVDVTDIEHPHVAAVNGDEMVYAASLPKIAILLGAFVQVERGTMTLDDDTRASLTRMIRLSSNHDATAMLRRVGKANLVKILQSERFRLYDPTTNGGLWVGKEYGKAPAWKRDPLHNLSHGATALQAARFYYLLETGRLVSDELSKEMKRMLSSPALHHKFVKGLKARPGARVYRKSGTWRHWHSDSAIVERDTCKYIVVALTQHRDGGEWLSRLIVSLDDMVVRSHRTHLSFRDESLR